MSTYSFLVSLSPSSNLAHAFYLFIFHLCIIYLFAPKTFTQKSILQDDGSMEKYYELREGSEYDFARAKKRYAALVVAHLVYLVWIACGGFDKEYM